MKIPMMTLVIEERIENKLMFCLDYWDNEGCVAELEIYASDLKNAKVGEAFKLDFESNSNRGVHKERLNITYKSDRGVAAILIYEGTTYDPLPEEWEEETMLIWFQFR